MKVTVYRPKEAFGLGSPQGFLGEEHPTQGDWVQSAKSVQADGVDPHMMLHQVGRDFLIYSMYHVREPRFAGYAVENFGAACKALGYSLPLKETEAVWLTYGPGELDPGAPSEHQFMLSQIANVFGVKAASEQAIEIGVEWPSRVTKKSGKTRRRYSLVERHMFENGDLRGSVIKSELYGVPQARHRVILLGIRDDLGSVVPKTLKPQAQVSVSSVLDHLPAVRSGLSRGDDSPQAWKE